MQRLSNGLLGLACAGLLSAALLSGAKAQDGSFLEAEVLQVLRGVQNGTMPPALAVEQCRSGIDEGEDPEEAESLRQVMTTYLEVPHSEAIPAFCDALMESVARKRLSAEELVPLIDGRDKNAEAFSVGRLLREVYVSHNDLISTPVTEELSR